MYPVRSVSAWRVRGMNIVLDAPGVVVAILATGRSGDASRAGGSWLVSRLGDASTRAEPVVVPSAGETTRGKCGTLNLKSSDVPHVTVAAGGKDETPARASESSGLAEALAGALFGDTSRGRAGTLNTESSAFRVSAAGRVDPTDGKGKTLRSIGLAFPSHQREFQPQPDVKPTHLSSCTPACWTCCINVLSPARRS